MNTITILDEMTSTLGKPRLAVTFTVAEERITLRELIRARVAQEVGAYNAKQGEYFQGLVQPTEAERTLNGYRLPRPRPLDPERQISTALAAFEANGFLVLVNDRQVENLDEPIEVTTDLSLTFLKLVPLVGG